MTRAILKYPGSKWGIAPWIVEHLSTTSGYVEPYCGSAAVFFALPWRPEYAVLNDLDGDVAAFLRAVRTDAERLAYLLSLTPWSRLEQAESYMPASDSGDLAETARRFVVRTWQGYGRRTGERAGWSHGRAGLTKRWRALPDDIAALADRLLDAEIESRPAIDVIRANAAPHILIYADPPYPRATRGAHKRLYKHDMTDDEHVALLAALEAHPGPVALSGYGCALYDERLRHWTRRERWVRVEQNEQRTEVLWLNERAAACVPAQMRWEE